MATPNTTLGAAGAAARCDAMRGAPHRLLALLLAAGSLLSQEPTKPADAFTAAEAWLGSDQTDQRALEQVIKGLFEVADREGMLRWVGTRISTANDGPKGPYAKGVETLVAHVTLEFLAREQKREMRFPGQYRPLLVLQPIVGRQLYRFLLDSPEWFPHTHRVQLVPAIRDVQVRLPDEQVMAAVQQLAEDEAREPISLRRALAALLWEWGRKEPGRRWLTELQRACTDGDAEERVVAMLDLAEFQYTLREYAMSSSTHRALQAMAKTSGVTLKPIAWYSSACVHNLAGKRDVAFAHLTKCLELLADPNLDASHRLKRDLFEQDPEIAALRENERFAELLERAVPKPKDGADKR